MTAVIWSHRAQIDLAIIDDYLAAIDTVLAGHAGAATPAAVCFFGEHPQAGPQLPSCLDRKRTVRGTGYPLIYRVPNDWVEILRVRHDREDWRTE